MINAVPVSLGQTVVDLIGVGDVKNYVFSAPAGKFVLDKTGSAAIVSGVYGPQPDPGNLSAAARRSGASASPIRPRTASECSRPASICSK